MNLKSLKNLIRIKMDTDPQDTDTYYNNFYTPLINECLSIIANTVLPYQGVIEINYGGKLDAGTFDELDENRYYKVRRGGTFIIGSKHIDAPDNSWLYYKDGWKIQKRNNYGFMIDIPRELLSFSSETLPQYTNYFGDILMDADVIKLNDKTLALPKDGDYKIWYNSEYPIIPDEEDEEKELDFIPPNVCKIIPSYVASQLLMAEDVQRAMIYKNEFETMLARLDDNKPLQSYNIKNYDGWTM